MSDAANPTFSSLPVGYDPSTYATQNYILNIIGQDLIPFTYSKKVACLDAVDDRIQAYPHSSVLAEIAVRPAARLTGFAASSWKHGMLSAHSIEHCHENEWHACHAPEQHVIATQMLAQDPA